MQYCSVCVRVCVNEIYINMYAYIGGERKNILDNLAYDY